MKTSFEPTRAAGLTALRDFLPHAGTAYAARRNYDVPGHPHVSRLSPYIRHRMVTEEEVLTGVLGRFSPRTAEKFIQEVYWRTYWKGWLEMRPSVWAGYRADLLRLQDRLATEGGLRKGWEQACTGTTGIAPFDHWAGELVETGYLHNHARMWFASIWVFTLGLPWQLGADFFLRHLLDGDPASNTLGWRWVAGLQTPGKVYTARAPNIAKYTEGRFANTTGLVADPTPADGMPNPPRGPMPETSIPDRSLRTGLVLTEDDLSPGWILDTGVAPVATAALSSANARSFLHTSAHVLNFTRAAIQDCVERYGARLGTLGPGTAHTPTDGEEQIDKLVAWAQSERLEQVVMAYPPVGPSGDALAHLRPGLQDAGISLALPIRRYDLDAWPYATHGFFRFKEKIPGLMGQLKGMRAA